jgi:hypothetical protein
MGTVVDFFIAEWTADDVPISSPMDACGFGTRVASTHEFTAKCALIVLLSQCVIILDVLTKL